MINLLYIILSLGVIYFVWLNYDSYKNIYVKSTAQALIFLHAISAVCYLVKFIIQGIK